MNNPKKPEEKDQIPQQTAPVSHQLKVFISFCLAFFSLYIVAIRNYRFDYYVTSVEPVLINTGIIIIIGLAIFFFVLGFMQSFQSGLGVGLRKITAFHPKPTY